MDILLYLSIIYNGFEMNGESHILNNYYRLLDNLPSEVKLSIIDMLSESVDRDTNADIGRFEKSFGALLGTMKADEIIENIHNSRKLNRKVETF